MISLVVPVMNRSDRIIPCLSTWIDHPAIDEVLIVDWSSSQPINTDSSLISVTEHPKTRIIRVVGEESFICMSFSLNVGCFYAKHDHIIKCDIDFQLKNTELVEVFKRSQGKKHFFCSTIPKKYDFHGFCFFEKKYFVEVNGYNEKIRGWGFDDEDFYRRLEKIGLERVVIMNIEEFIYHIPHDDFLRTENYPQKDKNATNKMNEEIIKQEDCGCLSTYKIIEETEKYIELSRNK